MDLEKVFKTDVNEITKSMSELEKIAVIQDIILKVRKHPNHQVLGREIDNYIKKLLGNYIK
jgi:hypothetical protein